MKEYIHIESMTKDLFEIYKDVLDDRKGLTHYRYICNEFDDDYLMEHAAQEAIAINMGMCKYLNDDTHSLCGNFNNIDYNYPRHLERNDKQVPYNAVEDMIDRLNRGVQDRQTEDDRMYLNTWYWETFGTFGTRYLFGHLVDSREDELRQELFDNLKPGVFVRWRDPEYGLYPDLFEVVEIKDDGEGIDEDTIVVLSNECSDFEVTAGELELMF